MLLLKLLVLMELQYNTCLINTTPIKRDGLIYRMQNYPKKKTTTTKKNTKQKKNKNKKKKKTTTKPALKISGDVTAEATGPNGATVQYLSHKHNSDQTRRPHISYAELSKKKNNNHKKKHKTKKKQKQKKKKNNNKTSIEDIW